MNAQEIALVVNAHAKGDAVQTRTFADQPWVDIAPHETRQLLGLISKGHYARIKPPKARRTIREDELPAFFWIKAPVESPIGGWRLVIGVRVEQSLIEISKAESFTLDYLSERGFVWSTDRRTERPFKVEVE